MQKAEIGEAKKAVAAAISCGVPIRPVGFISRTDLKNSGACSSALPQTPPLK